MARSAYPGGVCKTLWVLAFIDRRRARQGVAVRAGLVAPAIYTRTALADCTFALALKTQRGHALADRDEIVGSSGCIRRHVSLIITGLVSVGRPRSSADDAEHVHAGFVRGRATRCRVSCGSAMHPSCQKTVAQSLKPRWVRSLQRDGRSRRAPLGWSLCRLTRSDNTCPAVCSCRRRRLVDQICCPEPAKRRLAASGLPSRGYAAWRSSRYSS